MAKFKKGDRVRFIEEYKYRDMDYSKGSEAVVQSEEYDVVTLNESGLVYADKLELITDYQPITPKVGERYRVVKQNKEYLQATPGRIIKLLEDDKSDLPYLWLFSDNQDTKYMNKYDFVTTEYLELVEEEQHTGAALTVTQTNVNDVMNQAMRAMDMASKPFYVTGMDIGKMEPGSIFKMPTINKTKQTTMQKLTPALKRVLSADKQTLYKAGVIGSDLELTTRGQSNYTDALFNNEGDHKKAVAEMVAMAQAELDEA